MLDVLDLFSQMLTFCVGAFMMLCASMGAISAFNSLRLVVFAPDFQPHRNGRTLARGVVCATDLLHRCRSLRSASPLALLIASPL